MPDIWFTSSAQSHHPHPGQAMAELCEGLLRLAPSKTPDLLLLAFTREHVPFADQMGVLVREHMVPGCFMGTSVAGMLDGPDGMPGTPTLQACAAWMPGVRLAPVVLPNEIWKAGEEPTRAQGVDFFPGVPGCELGVLFADPFTTAVGSLLRALGREAGGTRICGGLASAGRRPGENRILLNDWVARDGAVLLGMEGELRADCFVSQGCRAVGPPLTVTQVQRHLLIELDHQPAVRRLEEVCSGLPEADQRLLAQGLLLGRPLRTPARGPGDFLVRHVMGVDAQRGVLAVSDHFQEGDEIRVQVRDPEAARADLEMLLMPQSADRPADLVLGFFSVGRDEEFFGESGTELGLLHRAIGDASLFAIRSSGEVGPVGSRSHLHGQGASLAILRSTRSGNRP